MGGCIERIKAGPTGHPDVPDTGCRTTKAITMPDPGS